MAVSDRGRSLQPGPHDAIVGVRGLKPRFCRPFSDAESAGTEAGTTTERLKNLPVDNADPK